MELSNILGALTGNDAISAISNNLKIDSKQVSSVITNAMPSLLGAMQKNASTPGGAEALAKALGDHASNAGNIINNLKGADLVDGSKILGHIFGGDLSSLFLAAAHKAKAQVALAAFSAAWARSLGSNEPYPKRCFSTINPTSSPD